MKKILIFIVCATIISVSFSQKKPIINFQSIEYDFGNIKEDGGVKTCAFDFTNQGDDTLIIFSVSPSCPCITAGWSQYPILPGQNGFVSIIYDPMSRPGPFARPIQVLTNDPIQQRITLLIKGFTESKPKTIEETYPSKFGNLRYDQTLIGFQNIANNETKVDTLRIYNEWNKTMTIAFSNLPVHLSCTAIPESLPPQTSGVIVISYNAEKRNDFGFVYERLQINTNDSLEPEKGINVSANIIEDFSKLSPEELAKAPKIHFDSLTYNFGTVTEGDKVEYDFHFSNKGVNDLFIRKTKASCGCTATNPDKTQLKSGESSNIHIIFNTMGKIGNQHKTITVICNDPENSMVILNIEGNVNKKTQ